MKTILKNTRLWATAFWLWLVVLVILTSLPATPGPEKFAGSGIRWDYLEHFSLYFLLPLLSFLSAGTAFKFIKYKNPAALLLVAGILFAVITETYQLWIPGRAFNPVDMMLNISGILTGSVTGNILKQRRARATTVKF